LNEYAIEKSKKREWDRSKKRQKKEGKVKKKNRKYKAKEVEEEAAFSKALDHAQQKEETRRDKMMG